MKIKSITLTMGSMVAVAAPIATVIACGSSDDAGFSYQKLESLVARATNVAQAQTAVSVSAATTWGGNGSTTASFKDGNYTHTQDPATVEDALKPSIEAIALANVKSGIASTGHYSVLIGLIKTALTDVEALAVHNAFVQAYNSGDIQTPKINDLSAPALYSTLKIAFATNSTLEAKLNMATTFA